MINIKHFDSNWLKIDKKSYRNLLHWIYQNEKSWLCKYAYCKFFVLYYWWSRGIHLRKNGNTCLIFASIDINKEVLTKYAKLWDEIKDLIEKINDKPSDY